MMTTEAEAGTAPRAAGRLGGRRSERRAGINALLASLAQGLRDDRAAAALRGRFEGELRQLVPVRSVRLRETAPPFAVGLGRLKALPDSVCLDIAVSGESQRAQLEATVDPTRPLDQWDLQTLGAAAHVASLVLEIERGAGQQAGHGGLFRCIRADGAAPLIGSSEAMQALRERIERLALTDFTVLIEGESVRMQGSQTAARMPRPEGRRFPWPEGTAALRRTPAIP